MKNTVHHALLACLGLFALTAQAETLDAVVRSTLDTHPKMLERAHERYGREEEVVIALRGHRPKIDAIASIGREESNSPGTRANGEDWVGMTRKEASIDLRQPLFDGGETRTNVERLRHRVDAAAYAVHAEAERVALRVAEAFLNVLTEQRLVDLSKQNLTDHLRIHDQIRQRSDSGVGRQSDLDQADARRALAESNVTADEGNLEQARVAYAAVVGDWPSDKLDPPKVSTSNLPASMQAAVDQAMLRHPSLQTAESDILSAHAQVDNARALMAPRIELQLAGRWGDDLDGVDGRDEDLQALINFRYNLYNGGADQARIRLSANLVEQTKDVRLSSQREISESVRLAWTSYTAVDRQMKSLERHVESTTRARDAYRKQFNIGERSLLDLLDSENELFEARRSLAKAERDRSLALMRIRAGIGELLPHLNVPIPEAAKPLLREANDDKKADGDKKAG